MPNTLLPLPFRNSTFARLSQDMDRLFHPAVALAEPAGTSWPGMNVWREADNILVEAEIPGFAQEDVEILATSDSLAIRGARRTQVPEGATPLYMEQQVTRFERVLSLGTPIDASSVRAELVNGVLRVTLPVAQAARARRIRITGGSEPARPGLNSNVPDTNQAAAIPAGEHNAR